MDKTRQLRDSVRRAYSAAAESPQDRHPFPVGWRFAQSLGYPQPLLQSLPSLSVDAFSGVSNVAVCADIPKGATVLDLGCGSGLDSLIASRRVGPDGRVIGVDFSDTMLARARRAAAEVGGENLEFWQADAENIPIKDGSIDLVMVNGIFNLNPARHAIFGELGRVVRKGGVVYAAELILHGPLPRELQGNNANWFA